MNLPVKTLFSCLLALPAAAQSPAITLYDIGLGGSYYGHRQVVFTEDQWAMLPGFSNPKTGDPDYGSYASPAYHIVDPAVSGQVQWKLPAKGTKNVLFGANVTVSGNMRSGITYTKTETGTYAYYLSWEGSTAPPLLVTGEVDTVYAYRYSFRSNAVSFNPRLVVESNSDKLVAVYGGIQGMLGFSVNSRLESIYQKTVRNDPFSPQPAYGTNEYTTDYRRERHPSKSVQQIGIAFPVGVLLRSYKKDGSPGSVSVALESTLGTYWSRVPEMKRTFNQFLFQAGLRLNYRL